MSKQAAITQAPTVSQRVQAANKKKRKFRLSRRTQYRYLFIVGGLLFLYSLGLVLLSFILQATATDTELYFQQGTRHLVNLVFVFLIAGMSSFLLALFFIHRYFDPYYHIKERFFRLAERNLTTRMDLEGNQDFEELSQDFNRFIEEVEHLIWLLRLEQEEVSMILLKAKKEAHLQSTRDILDKISQHNEKIIEQLLSYRVIGDR